MVGVAAMQERGVKVAASDVKAQTLIQDQWFRADTKLITRLDVTVYEGRALLTGIAPTRDLADEAVRLAWQVEGVTAVLNEIQVGDASVWDFTQDSWITAQLKGKLTFDQDILAVNYDVETVAGTVYLIGIAQDQRELDRVIAHTNTIGHVKRIINHVRLKTAK